MAATFGDSNGGEGPTKWNTTTIRRATDDELKRAQSVLAPLENNHDCSRDGCNGAARDGETHHYSHRASPDQHQYHDPGSPLADNITALVTVPPHTTDISTSSSTNQQTDNNITADQINLVCGEQMPASPLPNPPSSPGQNFLDEKTEDCVKPTTTTTAATTTSTDTTSAAAITSEVNLSRCRK